MATDKPRTEFDAATKRAIAERSGGVCEVHLVSRVLYPALPKSCRRPAKVFDHNQPDACDGEATLDNAAHLCDLCNAIKTPTDQKMAAKNRRMREETGQYARRKRRGKPLIQSRGFQTNKDGPYKQRMNGRTERR